MDAAPQPNAKSSPHKRLIIALIAVVLVTIVAFVAWPHRRAVVITGVHLGGYTVSFTNHSDERLYVNLLQQVKTNGQWVARTVGFSIHLDPHECSTNILTTANGPVVPTQPWRLHGSVSRKLDGVAANVWALRIYLDMLCHGHQPHFNPLTPNPTVFADAGEFVVYPVSEAARK